MLDVVGAGCCFFRAVSHQLYGEPSYQMNVRSTGVEYMRNDPERFIESSTDHSWLKYLAGMSQQGAWADAIIFVIQAVADALNLTIHIIESDSDQVAHQLMKDRKLNVKILYRRCKK